MSDETQNKETNITNETVNTEAVSDAVNAAPTRQDSRESRGQSFKKNKRSSKRKPKQRSEFDQKMINIRRVTRVSSGGRRFSFSVAILVGNKKGKVGVGTGKAGDTAEAIDKAVKDAQKKAIQIFTTKTMSIPHAVEAKYSSARVSLMPAKGRGLIAGSAVRDVLELAGISDINAKIFSGSKNKLNIAQATLKALSSIKRVNVRFPVKK